MRSITSFIYFYLVTSPSTFWLKKNLFPICEKFKTRTSSVISKYHLSINFLAQKRPYFSSLKSWKQKPFNNKLTWNFMLKKILSYRFIRTEISFFSALKISSNFCKNQGKIIFSPSCCVKKNSLYCRNP